MRKADAEAQFWQLVESLPNLSSFITIDTSTCMTGVDNRREQIHKDILAKLTEFNEELKSYFPQRISAVTIPPTIRHLRTEVIFLYRQLKFLEDKIFRLRTKLLKNACEQVESVIHLISDLIPRQYILNLNVRGFCDAVRTESKKLTAIKSAFPVLFRKYKQLLAPSPTVEQQQKRMHTLLNEVVSDGPADPETSFYGPHETQAEFERLIFLPKSGIEKKLCTLIDEFTVTKPQDFINGIFDLAEVFASTYAVRDNAEFSVVVTFLIRVVFSEVYPKVDVFKPQMKYMDVLAVLRELKAKDLAPPLNYCPPMDDDSDPGTVFRNEPNYRKAINHLEWTGFFTNPLDILNEIHLGFKEIEIAAAINKKDTCETYAMLPFDVTFGLFLCCLLGSDMSEYIRIAEFTKQYAPSYGLCPSFEFALTKIRAATSHITTLCQAQVDARKKKEM